MRKKKLVVVLVSSLFILTLTQPTFSQSRQHQFPEGLLPPMKEMGVNLRPISFPPEGSGYIIYELAVPAKVRIRITMSHPHAVVRTLIDWEERPAGVNKEFWNGKDSTGNPINLKNFMVRIDLEPLREGTLSNPIKSITGNPRNRRELNIRITSPANNATLTGITQITVRLIGDHRGYSAKAGNGLRVFLNYNPEYIKEIYFRGTDTFTWQWDTRVVPNGEHILTINVCDHNDHVGVETIKVNIRN